VETEQDFDAEALADIVLKAIKGKDSYQQMEREELVRHLQFWHGKKVAEEERLRSLSRSRST
jgi:hypothetical protein